MRRIVVVALALLLAACCCDPCRRTCCPSACGPCGGVFQTADGGATWTKSSLFDRVGGMKGLEAIVDDFFPRIMGDTRVMGNPAVGAKMKAADPKVVRQRTIEKMCELIGGPCKYGGRDMKTAHHGLGITKAEWEAAGQDFLAALEHRNVSQADRAEFMAAIGAIEKDVVEKP